MVTKTMKTAFPLLYRRISLFRPTYTNCISAALMLNVVRTRFESILYSFGSKPLQKWDKFIRNGHIKRLKDTDIQSFVLKIMSTNVSTTFISASADPAGTLEVKLPILVRDDKNICRSFRASSYHSKT